MQRTLIAIGLTLLLAGLLWPWISKIGLFRLPGDIVIEQKGFRFYLPITSAVLISLVVSIFLWLLRK